MRAPNEIDFWRGFALVTIFINHVPGIYFERFTFRNVSLSDSAELFVFLAGCALRILVDGAARALPAQWLLFRLEARAFHVYVAQVFVTEMAIALLAAAAFLLDAPYLLDWHNTSAVFNDPVRAHIGLVLLTHSLAISTFCPSTSFCFSSLPRSRSSTATQGCFCRSYRSGFMPGLSYPA